MLKNYLTIAIRNLLKNKVFSVINMFGLAMGIACCFLITVYVYHQLSYDHFHDKADRIVRVTMDFGAGESGRNVVVTGTRVLPELERNFPEVQNGVRFLTGNTIVKYNDKAFDEAGFVYADSTFFDVFSFKLVEGNAPTALSRPNSVVLTHSTAKKYFGETDAIGKIMRVDNQSDYIVTGIVEDCPDNSQIKFDFLASFSSLEVSKTEEWYDASYITYLLLSSPESIEPLQVKVDRYMKQQSDVNGKDRHLSIFLQPMLLVHLHPTVEGGFEPAGDFRYVYIFGAIAVLILGIACANYINLTTAKASMRAKEVGMRKVLGAVRMQLISQFLGESIVLVLMSLVVSMVVAQGMLPTFNLFSGSQLTFAAIATPIPIIAFGGIVLIIILLGGGYPAFVLSRFMPASTLKGNFQQNSSGIPLRRVLIVIQFVISGGLIISTMIIRSQLDFIQNRRLGYDTHHVISFPVSDEIRDPVAVLKTALSTHPDIFSITIASRSPVEVNSSNTIVSDNGTIIVNQIRTDSHFIRTLGIKIIDGMDFTEADEKTAKSEARPDFVGGKSKPFIIMNESAVAAFYCTPEEAIGKSVSLQGQPMQVKAVIEDFHFASMHEPIAPLVLFIGEHVTRMMIKVSRDHLAQTIDFINTKWNVLLPQRPFEYEFLDDQFNNLYKSESRTSHIFYAFALLAIGLACLGLLGLVAFTAQQRTKEIGIRKVLGASVRSIFVLLSKDFLLLVIVAFGIASPIAYYVMNHWLRDFAYHIDIDWHVFLFAGLASVLLVLITISFQAIKTALNSPVNSLRSE